MENKKYKVIGISSYEGTSKTGQKAKIKTFENNAKIGDFVGVNIGLKKSIYGNELTAVVVGVYPAAEMTK